MRIFTKLIKVFLFLIFFSNTAFAINEFKFLQKEVSGQFCKELFNRLDFPGFPSNQKQPFKLNTELIIEDINKVDGKNLDFDALFTLYVYWKDPRIASLLKDMGMYEDTNKPAWLCDYDPNIIWGVNRKIFDPVVEFYNRKDKPDFIKGRADWIEIFSNGTVQSRIRDTAKFKSNFNFKKFPFDKQIFKFELYTEFPVTRTVFEPNKIMKKYEDSLYDIEGEDGIHVPGWKVTNVKTSLDRYTEGDYDYEGFILEITAERVSFYYLIKIFLPIIFILGISWSVFWVHPREVDAKVNITIVALLALIAYNFIIDEEIPKLDYLTFLDAFIFVSYIFTGASTMLCVYAHYRFEKYKNPINKVDYYSKFLGPISYFSILMIIIFYFL